MSTAASASAEMAPIVAAQGSNEPLEAWDYRYYAEKLRKAKYDLSDDEVKRIVDVGLWKCTLVVVRYHFGQRLAAHLHRERNDRSRPATQCRKRAALEIVGSGSPLPRLLVHMAVSIDTTGQHKAPLG